MVWLKTTDEIRAGRAYTGETDRFASAANARETDNYYQGAILVPVETGLYNENYIEIVSGLKEGDIVILPQQSTSTSSPAFGQNQPREGFRMPMGGMGGIGGGGFSMPGGGRP